MATGTREHPLQLVQFPFTAGIDEGTRDEVVEAGSGWAVLENGRQDHRGGYSTRNGFTATATARTDATSPTTGYKLFAAQEMACRIAENKLDVYVQQSAAWKQIGRVPECITRQISMPSVGAASTLEDVEYCNGYLAVSSYFTSGAQLAVLDAATGAMVLPPVGFGTGWFPLVASFSSRYFIALGASGARIDLYILDTNTAASVAAGWTSLVTVGTDVTGSFIASMTSLSDRVAVAYITNGAGTDRVNVKTYNQTGLLESATVGTSSVTPDAVDIAGSNADTLWVSWNEATLVKMKGLTGNSLASVKATTATIATATTGVRLIGISPSTTGVGRLLVNNTSTPPQVSMIGFQTSAGAAAALGSQITVFNAAMCGRPFYYGTRHYAPFFGGITTTALTGNTQKNLIVADWTDDYASLRPIANLFPSLAVVSTFGKAKTVVGATAWKLYTAAGVTRSGVADSAAVIEVDFGSGQRWRAVAHGGSTFLSGGLLSYFDGVRVAEAGYLIRPTLPTTATSATGITASTGWRYVCVYEEIDGDGNWHVSGLSSPSASTGAVANKTVTVTTSPLTISSRINTTTNNSVRVAFYRTLDGGSAPYYRLGVTGNSTAASTVTYADTTTDATLAANAKLYSQPGVVGTAQDRRPPPGLGMIVSYNGVLVGASGSDVWFSGQDVLGEGTWFNPIFQVPVPGDGDITAMWVMDGTLYVAKRREIYAISGEAPSDNGATGGLGQPRRLAVDVGCIESRSPCVTALGTFFQSDRGIEILTRAQTVEWIGESVQDTLASYPIITAATVDPASCTVLVECAAGESAGLVTGSGRTPVYDLSLRTWVSTDRRTDRYGIADAPTQSACIVYTGSAYRYAWLDSVGNVATENTTHLDAGGNLIAKRAVSGNVKASGFQGHQHVNKTLLLAKYHTPHDLNVSFAYDYSSSYKTVRLYTAAQLLTLTGQIPNLQIEHPMHDDARCEAVRVQLQDVTPSSGSVGTGQGATWIALAFEIVPQSGAYHLPDAAR